MRTLIAYTTKYGCTTKCAEILKPFLEGEVVIRPVKDIKEKLDLFDTIILGGSVYMGKIQKSLTHFCCQQKKILLKKKLGIYISCYTPKDTPGFLESLFPEELLKHATYATTVGGVMDYKKMNFAYRKLFESLKKIDGFNEGFTEPSINIDEIHKLADAMK